MKLLEYGILSILLGCMPEPREPYLWREDAPPIGVHRADVARAEGKVIEYLAASGTLDREEYGCSGSARAYDVFTVETESAFEVRLTPRPGLCHQAPEDTNLPRRPYGFEGNMWYAVRKSDFRIIRVRWPSDPYVPFVFKPKPVPPPKNALAFTTPGLRVAVGACSGPVSMETRDPSGNRVAVTEAVAVNIAATPPSAVFFSDATCSTALTSVGVDAGKSGAEVYFFRATQVGPLQINATATSLTGASQTHAVDPAQAMAVAFVTPPRTVSQGRCSEAVTVQARDAFDNPANVRAETFVQLQANPAKGIKLHARPDCTGPVVTRAPIAAGGNSASVYLKGGRPGTFVLTAALGMSAATQDALVTSPLPPAAPGEHAR